MDLNELGRILSDDRKPNGEYSPEAISTITALFVAGVPRHTIAAAFGTRRPATVNNIARRFMQRKTQKTKARSGRPHTRALLTSATFRENEVG
ncbi:hypothetical protein PG988_016066 [Apiospora saccharicola]